MEAVEGILEETKYGITFRVILKGKEGRRVRDLLLDNIEKSERYNELIIPQGEISCMTGAELYLWSFGIELESNCLTYFEGGATVENITDKSPAERDGRLKVGDRVLEVNGVPAPNFMRSGNKSLSSGDTLKLKAIRPDARMSDYLTYETAKGLKRSKDDDIVFDVRGEEIMSFRSLIAAHSPVLEGMFAHDTLEKRTRRIKVDFDPKAFNAVLSFLRTSCLKPLEKGYRHLLEIAQIADYYEIKAIGKQLHLRLQLYKSQETAVDMVVTAYELGLTKEEFMKSLLTYIALWWPEIKEAQTHILVSHPDLLVELCSCIHEEKEQSRKFFSNLDIQLRPIKANYPDSPASLRDYDYYAPAYSEDEDSEDDSCGM